MFSCGVGKFYIWCLQKMIKTKYFYLDKCQIVWRITCPTYLILRQRASKKT